MILENCIMSESLLLRDATVQEIQLELLRRSSFNALDGERLVDSLRLVSGQDNRSGFGEF